MYADRYQRTRAHPGSLAAAATVTGAMIMALMSSAPEIVPADIFKNITAIAIPLDPPEPPPPPEKRVEPQPRETAVTRPVVDEKIVVPDVLPPIDSGAGVEVTVDPGPPILPSQPSGGAATAEPAPPVMGAVTPDPRYARDFQPAYPTAKERAGEEARITVRVLVGIDGRVRAVEPVGVNDDAFFASTRRQALAKWRFRPATRDGVPYEAWHTMSVRFELTE